MASNIFKPGDTVRKKNAAVFSDGMRDKVVIPYDQTTCSGKDVPGRVWVYHTKLRHPVFIGEFLLQHSPQPVIITNSTTNGVTTGRLTASSTRAPVNFSLIDIDYADIGKKDGWILVKVPGMKEPFYFERLSHKRNTRAKTEEDAWKDLCEKEGLV